MEPTNRSPEVPTESTVSQPVAPPERKTRSMKPFVIGGVILVLVVVALGFFTFMPIVAAAQWRTSTIDTVNKNIEDLNKSTKEITYLASKLQPSDEDKNKLIAELKKSDQILHDSKTTIKPLGGAPIVDVTGEYKKTADIRKNILAAYDKLIELNTTDLKLTETQQKVAKIMADFKEFSTSEEANKGAQIFRDSASEMEKLGNSQYGTQLDKDYAKQLNKMADAIKLVAEAMDSNNEAKANKAQSDADAAQAAMDDLDAKYHDQGVDYQKKIDNAVDELNKAVKSLEF